MCSRLLLACFSLCPPFFSFCLFSLEWFIAYEYFYFLFLFLFYFYFCFCLFNVLFWIVLRFCFLYVALVIFDLCAPCASLLFWPACFLVCLPVCAYIFARLYVFYYIFCFRICFCLSYLAHSFHIVCLIAHARARTRTHTCWRSLWKQSLYFKVRVWLSRSYLSHISLRRNLVLLLLYYNDLA